VQSPVVLGYVEISGISTPVASVDEHLEYSTAESICTARDTAVKEQSFNLG
jgi:hypothetical protein